LVNSHDQIGHSSFPIFVTPVTDAEDLEGVKSIFEAHLLTYFLLEFFQLRIGKFYDPAASFADQMVMMLMAQDMFIVVSSSPEIDYVQ